MAVTPPPTTTWWYEFVAALIEHARTRGYALPKLESSIDRTFVHLVTYTSWCICVSGSDSFPIRFQSSCDGVFFRPDLSNCAADFFCWESSSTHERRVSSSAL